MWIWGILRIFCADRSAGRSSLIAAIRSQSDSGEMVSIKTSMRFVSRTFMPTIVLELSRCWCAFGRRGVWSPFISSDREALRDASASYSNSVLNYTVRVDLKTPKGPRSFAVSGDGQITDASKALVHDVDCLFQEVYSEKPGIPVHADLETVVTWASNTQIKHVVTSHFARSARTKLSKKVSARKSKSPRWSVARPEAVVWL